MVNAVFYFGVMKRLLVRIRRARPEYHEKRSWRLFHDNALAHRSKLITDFLVMKGKRYADIEDIHRSTTAIPNKCKIKN